MTKLIFPVLVAAAIVTGCTSVPEQSSPSMDASAAETAQNIAAICGGYAVYADDNGKGEFQDVFNECMELAKEMVRDATW